MLVLSRKQGESIILELSPEDLRAWQQAHPGETLRVAVKCSAIQRDKCRLAIGAPAEVKAYRDEIWFARQREQSQPRLASA